MSGLGRPRGIPGRIRSTKGQIVTKLKPWSIVRACPSARTFVAFWMARHGVHNKLHKGLAKDGLKADPKGFQNHLGLVKGWANVQIVVHSPPRPA